MKKVFCFLLLSSMRVDGFYNSIIFNRDEEQEQPVWSDINSRIPFWLQDSVSDNEVDLGLSDINSESKENDLDYFINSDSGPVYIRKSEEAEQILGNQDYHPSSMFTILNDVLRNSKPPDFKFEDNYEVTDTKQTVTAENSSSILNESGSLSELSGKESNSGSIVNSKNYTDGSVVVDSVYDALTDYEHQSSFGEEGDKQRINSSSVLPDMDSPENNAAVRLEADIYDQQFDDLIAMENSWDAGNYVLNSTEDVKDVSLYGYANQPTFSSDKNTAADFGDVITLDKDFAANDSSSTNFESNHSNADVFQKDLSEINRSNNNDRFANTKLPGNVEENRDADAVTRSEDIVGINRNQRPSDGIIFEFAETNNDVKIDDSASMNVSSKDCQSNSLNTQTVSSVDSDNFHPTSTSLSAESESKKPKSIDALLISPDELLNYMEDTYEEESPRNSAYLSPIGVVQESVSAETFSAEKFKTRKEPENTNKNRNEIGTIISGNSEESTTVISISELHERSGNGNANYFKPDFVDGWILNNSENQNNAIPDVSAKNNQFTSVNQHEAELQNEKTPSNTSLSQELPATKTSNGMINVQDSETLADNAQSESGTLKLNEIKLNPGSPPCNTSGNCPKDVDINSSHYRNPNMKGSINSSIKPKWNNAVQQSSNTIPVIQGEWVDELPKPDEEERVKLSDAIVSTLRGPEKESSVYKRVLEYTVGEVLLDKALLSNTKDLQDQSNGSKILIAANKTFADNAPSDTTGATNINDDAYAKPNFSFPKYSDNLTTLLNENLKLQPSNMKVVPENSQEQRVRSSATPLTGGKSSNYTDSSILYEVQPRKAINQIKNVSTDIFFREWNAEEINVLSANSKSNLPENLQASKPNSKQNRNFYLPFDILNENEEAIDIFNTEKALQSAQTSRKGKVVDRSRSDIPIDEDEDYMDQDYDYDS